MPFPNLKFFKPSEFTCKCGCGLNNMKPIFLFKLEQARELAAIPFIITSGCRCGIHNAKEGGKASSDHLTGEGVDIKTFTSQGRFKVVTAALSVGLTRIGIGNTFTHLGDRRNNPKNVIWKY